MAEAKEHKVDPKEPNKTPKSNWENTLLGLL